MYLIGHSLCTWCALARAVRLRRGRQYASEEHEVARWIDALLLARSDALLLSQGSTYGHVVRAFADEPHGGRNRARHHAPDGRLVSTPAGSVVAAGAAGVSAGGGGASRGAGGGAQRAARRLPIFTFTGGVQPGESTCRPAEATPEPPLKNARLVHNRQLRAQCGVRWGPTIARGYAVWEAATTGRARD